MITVNVLGSTGMLGHAVIEHLSQIPLFTVRAFSRRDGAVHYLNALNATRNGDFNFCTEADYVINCIGAVWQANPNHEESFAANMLFPQLLQVHCQNSGAKLIHVSTDCVFDGMRHSGNYTENDLSVPFHPAADADATIEHLLNNYRLSKSLGEPRGALVIRTSLIGRELETHRSLLGWSMAHAGQRIEGYTNHVWNGITCREFARCCEKIILQGLYKPGPRHIFSTTVTKYDLLCRINAALGLGQQVVPTEHPVRINRTLSTVYSLCGLLRVPDLTTMIADL